MSVYIYRGTYRSGGFFREDPEPEYTIVQPYGEDTCIYRGRYEKGLFSSDPEPEYEEPEYDENEPSDPYVSQYPLEDILDEFFISCYDSYDEENETDKEHSYIEFAADDIEDIRKVLSLIGKHVYNKQEGDYVELKIEDQ